MTPLITADGLVWMSPPRLGKLFNKHGDTIRIWCHSGFILTLGYKLKRDPKGHYLIGIPASEYLENTVSSIDSPSPSVFPSTREHSVNTQP